MQGIFQRCTQQTGKWGYQHVIILTYPKVPSGYINLAQPHWGENAEESTLPSKPLLMTPLACASSPHWETWFKEKFLNNWSLSWMLWKVGLWSGSWAQHWDIKFHLDMGEKIGKYICQDAITNNPGKGMLQSRSCFHFPTFNPNEQGEDWFLRVATILAPIIRGTFLLKRWHYLSSGQSKLTDGWMDAWKGLLSSSRK